MFTKSLTYKFVFSFACGLLLAVILALLYSSFSFDFVLFPSLTTTYTTLFSSMFAVLLLVLLPYYPRYTNDKDILFWESFATLLLRLVINAVISVGIWTLIYISILVANVSGLTAETIYSMFSYTGGLILQVVLGFGLFYFESHSKFSTSVDVLKMQYLLSLRTVKSTLVLLTILIYSLSLSYILSPEVSSQKLTAILLSFIASGIVFIISFPYSRSFFRVFYGVNMPPIMISIIGYLYIILEFGLTVDVGVALSIMGFFFLLALAIQLVRKVILMEVVGAALIYFLLVFTLPAINVLHLSEVSQIKMLQRHLASVDTLCLNEEKIRQTSHYLFENHNKNILLPVFHVAKIEAFSTPESLNLLVLNPMFVSCNASRLQTHVYERYSRTRDLYIQPYDHFMQFKLHANGVTDNAALTGSLSFVLELPNSSAIEFDIGELIDDAYDYDLTDTSLYFETDGVYGVILIDRAELETFNQSFTKIISLEGSVFYFSSI